MVTRNAFWLVGLICLCSFGTTWAQLPLFINEIHYNDAGTDTLEAVEVAGPAGTNLSCFRIYLYNGAAPGAAVVYDSIVLSGILPDQCNGFGTANFLVTSPKQIQNGNNDGFALVFKPTFAGCATIAPPTVVQLLSYQGTFTCANGPAIGMTSTDIGVSESSGTLENTSLQLSGSGVLYSDFTWSPTAVATRGALNNGQTFGGLVCGTGPVIASEIRFRSTPSGCLLPGGSFLIEVAGTNAGGYVSLSYNAVVTLSLISGPGVLSGTTSSMAIGGVASFPGLSLSATGTYQFRATDGVFSDTSTFVYVQPTCATCPNLNAVLVDGCGTQEGRNEILFFNSGNFAIPVNPNAFSINYGTTASPSTGYTNNITSNQPYINALNAAAGCSLFHDALLSSPIPPNTNFLVMSYTPLTTYNFSAWCFLGSVYVIFSNDPDWDTTSGNWKNCLNCLPLGSGTTPRYFNANFSGLNGGAGCNFTYNYTPCTDLLCNGDGDGIDFGYGGGTPTDRWTECTPTNVLPVAFSMGLKGARDDRDVQLNWETSIEVNSSYFSVQRSLSATGPFQQVGTLPAAGVSSTPQSYAMRDFNAPADRLWYRLAEVDFNGASNYSQVVMVSEEVLRPSVQISHHARIYDFLIEGNGAVNLQLYSVDGRLVRSVQGNTGTLELDLSSLDAGVYLYHIVSGAATFSGKLPLID